MNRIRTLLAEIHELNSLQELYEYIWPNKIGLFVVFVLSFWMLSPLIVMIQLLEPANGDVFSILLNNMYRISYWKTLLTQVGLIGLGILFVNIIFLIKNKNTHFFKDHIEVGFLILFILWAILSTLVNEDRVYIWTGATHQLEGLSAYLMYVGIFTLAYTICLKKHVIYLFKTMIFVSSILVILSIIDIDFINELFTLTKLSSVFFNQNHFGYYLVISTMVSAFLYIEEKKIVYLVLFGIMSLGLNLNKSFGPFIAVFISLLIFIYVVYKKNIIQKKYLIWTVLVFMSSIFLVNLTTNQLFTDLFRLGTDVTDILSNSEDAGSAGSARWVLWKNAFRFIREKPLFGYGIDNLGKQYKLVGINMDRPHNEFIQFAASMGIPGLIFYLGAMISTFIKFIKAYKDTDLFTIALFFIAFAYIFSSFFGNTKIYTFPYYIIIIAIFIKQLNQTKN